MERNHDNSKASPIDKKLLKKYGIKRLQQMGYFGVLDRLNASGIIQTTGE